MTGEIRLVRALDDAATVSSYTVSKQFYCLFFRLPFGRTVMIIMEKVNDPCSLKIGVNGSTIISTLIKCFHTYMILIFYFKCTLKSRLQFIFYLDQSKILLSGNGLRKSTRYYGYLPIMFSKGPSL